MDYGKVIQEFEEFQEWIAWVENMRHGPTHEDMLQAFSDVGGMHDRLMAGEISKLSLIVQDLRRALTRGHRKRRLAGLTLDDLLWRVYWYSGGKLLDSIRKHEEQNAAMFQAFLDETGAWGQVSHQYYITSDEFGIPFTVIDLPIPWLPAFWRRLLIMIMWPLSTHKALVEHMRTHVADNPSEGAKLVLGLE